MQAFTDPCVEAVFQAWPPPVRRKLLALRQVIFAVAARTPGVGALEETLKWGQPAYLTPHTRSGSTVRLGWDARRPGQYAVYFHCQTRLVEQFKTLFPHDFRFEGQRAIVFQISDTVPTATLQFCIGMALTYHLVKRPRMTPHLVHRDQPLHLAGITTRTTNAAEFSPTTAKIAPLWQRFFSERVAQSVAGYTPQSALYGVYSGYESDAMGAFDVSAAVLATEVPEGLEAVTVPAGPYLVFEAQGPMPATVIALWGAVWLHFQDPAAPARRYGSDFEEYSGEGRIAIYIGVQDAA